MGCKRVDARRENLRVGTKEGGREEKTHEKKGVAGATNREELARKYRNRSAWANWQKTRERTKIDAWIN